MEYNIIYIIILRNKKKTNNVLTLIPRVNKTYITKGSYILINFIEISLVHQVHIAIYTYILVNNYVFA